MHCLFQVPVAVLRQSICEPTQCRYEEELARPKAEVVERMEMEPLRYKEAELCRYEQLQVEPIPYEERTLGEPVDGMCELQSFDQSRYEEMQIDPIRYEEMVMPAEPVYKLSSSEPRQYEEMQMDPIRYNEKKIYRTQVRVIEEVVPDYEIVAPAEYDAGRVDCRYDDVELRKDLPSDFSDGGKTGKVNVIQ